MSKISNFFEDLLLKLSMPTMEANPLVKCLSMMMSQMNIPVKWNAIDKLDEITLENIKEYEQSLGIILYRVSALTLDDLSVTVSPTLIQLKGSDQLYVLVKEKLFNPTTNQYVSKKNILIKSAWQCSPIYFPVVSNFKELLKSTCQYFKKEILFSILLGCIVSVSAVFLAMMASYIFGHIEAIAQADHAAIFIAFFVILLSIAIFSYINDLYIKSLNVKVVSNTLPSLFYHILQLPMQAVRKIVSGDLAQRFSEYETAISIGISTSLMLLFNVIALLFLLAYMFYCNAKVAFLYLLICVTLTLFKLAFLPANIKHITTQQAEQGKLAALLHEILLQIHVIRSACVESTVFKKWLAGLVNVKLHAEKSIKIEILIWAIESLIPFLVLLSFYSVIYFFPAMTSPSAWLQFIICAGQFTGIFEKLSSEIVLLLHRVPSLNQMSSIISEPPENSMLLSSPHRFEGGLIFSNVSLRHSTTGLPILENICIDIQPGQFVAIVGPTGAGKSTLLKLLLGFESISSGAILIDGVNSQTINQSSIRKQLGVVLQSSSLLPGTIFTNIAANASITLDEAWQLAIQVGLDKEIQAMPMKMQTYISDNAGESLSGGQKQKILIARALATQPKILLLDEATSALDNASQAVIHHHLSRLNMTRIVIAHRLNTIMAADIIYFLDKGRIIAKGSYAELVQQGYLVG